MFILKSTSRATAPAIGKDVFTSSANADLEEQDSQLDNSNDAAANIWEMANLLAWEETKKKYNQEKDGGSAVVEAPSTATNKMDVSLDVTEMSESTADWMAGVAENAKMLQKVTERTKSASIDYNKLPVLVKKVKVPVTRKGVTTTLPGVQFTGSVGAGSRSVIASQPLPKPQAVLPVPAPTDLVSVCDASSVMSSVSTMKKPKMLKSMLRRGSRKNVVEQQLPPKQVTVDLTPNPAEPTPIEFKPFVSPFKMPNGNMSVTPRMISYYEVEIVPYQEEDLDETSDETYDGDSDVLSSSHHHGETTIEEKKEEEVDPEILNSQNEQEDAQEDAPVDIIEREAPASEPVSDIEDSAEEDEEEEDEVTECVAVGLAFGNFRMSCRMPGWDQFSIGYHGDDGNVFHRRQTEQSNFGPAFMRSEKNVDGAKAGSTAASSRNVVGCGIDYSKGSVFFTRNGEFLGYAADLPEELLAKDWYPTVGIDSRSSVVCNFGYDRAFDFDLQGLVESRNNEHETSRLLDSLEKTSEVSMEGNEDHTIQVVG